MLMTAVPSHVRSTTGAASAAAGAWCGLMLIVCVATTAACGGDESGASSSSSGQGGAGASGGSGDAGATLPPTSCDDSASPWELEPASQTGDALLGTDVELAVGLGGSACSPAWLKSERLGA